MSGSVTDHIGIANSALDVSLDPVDGFPPIMHNHREPATVRCIGRLVMGREFRGCFKLIDIVPSILSTLNIEVSLNMSTSGVTTIGDRR